MSLAQRIKQIRESKLITQAYVSDVLEIDRTHYNRLEKRGERMTLEQLQRIADALEVPLAELLGIEPDTITEVQAVGAESVLRFRKREVALNNAVKVYMSHPYDMRREHDLLRMARDFEAYLDEE